MYINFQQTRVSRSVQTVHTKYIANNRNLHKFATINSNFVKVRKVKLEIVIMNLLTI